MQVAKQLLDVLQSRSARADWDWEDKPQLSGGGASFQVAGKRFHLVLNALPVARGPELERALADALLRARASDSAGAEGVVHLPVVAAPSLSIRMLMRLQKYVDEVLQIEHWGAFDLAGSWHFPKLPQVIRAEPVQVRIVSGSVRIRQSPPPAHDPFSDLGQWLTKVVLAKRIDPALLSAPRVPLPNLAALALAADVSLPTVSRWASAMRKEKYLVDGADGLEIVRVPMLLERWANAARGRQYDELWVRPVLGGSDSEKLIHRIADASPRAVLLGAEACRRLDVGVVMGAPLQIALPSLDPDVLQDLGLVPAQSSQDAALLLRRPRQPESLQRGAVRHNEIAVADILQCAIEARHAPDRGMEQYDAILRHLKSASR